MKMKKIFLGLAFCALGFCMAGCKGDKYSQEDKTKIETQGRQILTKLLPQGASMISLKALEDKLPSGPSYLTDYVEGEYKAADGKIYRYVLNTQSSKLYSSKNFDKLQGVLEKFVGKNFLNNNLKVKADAVQILLDNTKGKGNKYIYASVLPIEVTDVNAYVNSKDRDLLWLNGNAKQNETDILRIIGRAISGDKLDLYAYTLERLDSLSANHKIKTQLNMQAGGEDIFYISNRSAKYKKWADRKMDDIKLRGVVIERSESKDSKTGKVMPVEYKEYDLNKLSLERTKDGYAFNYPDKDDKKYERIIGKPQVYIFAKPTANIMANEYKAKAPSINTSTDLVWKEDKQGYWVLSNFHGPIALTSDYQLLVRAQR